ncbi:MAG: hypothetical protein AB1599_09475, partial [Planctomycetota bacterium]
LNRVCYDEFVKPTDCKYLKLHYDPDMKKIAFEPVSRQIGEITSPIKLVKPGLFGLVNGKTFLDACGINYQEKIRSYPVHQPLKYTKIKGIEIKLTEYFPDKSI